MNTEKKQFLHENKNIGVIIQQWMLNVIIAALFVGLAGTILLQVLYQREYSYRVLESHSGEMLKSVDASFDNSIEQVMNQLVSYLSETKAYEKDNLYMQEWVNLNNHFMSEANIVDENGIILLSSNPDYAGTEFHPQPLQAISYDDNTRMKYYGVPFPDGKYELQVGIDEEKYYALKQNSMVGAAEEGRIGISGFLLVCDRERNIVGGTGEKYEGQPLPSDVILPKAEGEIKRSEYRFDGKNCYVLATLHENSYVLCFLPVSEAMRGCLINILLTAALFAGVLFCAFYALARLLKSQVVKGIEDIHGSLSRISAGDLEEKADVRSSLEMKELSGDINQTVDRLKQLIREAEERIDEELKLAATIQTSFLPQEFPNHNAFELYASMIPAKEVGGDFYDFFLIDDNHLALVMADVSGKGIPAAMFMVMVKNKIREAVMKYRSDVAGAIREINTSILKENQAELFVTIWLGVLNISDGVLPYVDAGHEPPAIRRNGEAFRIFPDVHSTLVGMVELDEVEAGTLVLSSGDVLFLYTDGVTEAHDPKDNLFGEERMLDALNRDPQAPVKEIDGNVRAAIAEFVRERPLFDDTTTLCLRYKKEIRKQNDPEEGDDWFL